MTININSINNTYLPQYNLRRNKKNTLTKTASIAGSTAGVITALGLISGKHGIKIPSSFIKQPKEVLDVFKKLEFNETDVIKIASSSILGGFAFGSAADFKNIKAKAQEGIVQLAGNYIIPTLFAGAGIRLNKALNKKFNFPPITKPIQFAFGLTSLIAGVIAGNKVSKVINTNVFDEDMHRKLSWKDWAVQFDNVCLVTSVSNSGTKLAKMASRVIPAAHIIPGYLTGTKKENIH